MRHFMFIFIAATMLLAFDGFASTLLLGIGGKDLDSNPKVIDKNIDYNKMIAYLKSSNDPEKIFSLGMIYVNGVVQNGKTVISPDPVLAEKYMLKAAQMGYKKAKTILGGLYVFNKNMQRLDPDGSKAEKLLKEEYEKGNTDAGLLLSSLYIVQGRYKLAFPILLKEAENGSAEAQFSLALLFKEGVSDSVDGFNLKPDERAALYYLNKACLNPNKSEEIKKICYDPRYVVMEKKPPAEANASSK